MRFQAVLAIMPSLSDDQDRALRGGWLVAALLTVVYLVASLPSTFIAFQRVCTGQDCPVGALTSQHVRELEAIGRSPGFFASYLLAHAILLAGVSLAVGGGIFWVKADDRMALFVALTLVASAALAFSQGNDVAR
jgi:hypothetical protein